MFPFASVFTANPEVVELRLVNVVTPSVKLNESGVKLPEPPSCAGVSVILGAKGCATVNDPVIRHVGGQAVPTNCVSGTLTKEYVVLPAPASKPGASRLPSPTTKKIIPLNSSAFRCGIEVFLCLSSLLSARVWPYHQTAGKTWSDRIDGRKPSSRRVLAARFKALCPKVGTRVRYVVERSPSIVTSGNKHTCNLCPREVPLYCERSYFLRLFPTSSLRQRKKRPSALG